MIKMQITFVIAKRFNVKNRQFIHYWQASSTRPHGMPQRDKFKKGIDMLNVFVKQRH